MDVIEPLKDVGEVAIVGGLVRDIVRYGIKDRPISDIDLVVKGSPSAVAAIARRLSATPNRFGGFSAVSDYYKADFWALSKTWARSHAGVHIEEIGDIVNSTFFNWDAIVYSIKDEAVYAKDSYIDDIRNKFLEINLTKTASHKGNLVRSLRRLMAWQAEPGPMLFSFMIDGLDRYGWQAVITQEKSAFYNNYLDTFVDFDDYLRHLRGDNADRFRPIQLQLFGSDELPILPRESGTTWFRRTLKKSQGATSKSPKLA